jgi:hypothetical protein
MDYLTVAAELRKHPSLKHWGEHDLPRWLRDKCKCAYCDRDFLRSFETAYYDYTYDHLLPKSEYKELECNELNLVLCCWQCNKRKATWDPNNWSRGATPALQVRVYDGHVPFDDGMRTKLIKRVRLGFLATDIEDKRRFVDEQRLLREALLDFPQAAGAAAGR